MRRADQLAGRILRALAWAAVGAFLVVTFLWPLALVLLRSVAGEGLAHYGANFGSDAVRTIMWRTMRLGLVVTLVCLVLAYPAAYALATLRSGWRNAAIALIILPSLTSFLVRTYAWMAVLGTRGPIVGAMNALGLEVQTLNGSFGGVIVAMVHMLLPLMVLPIYAAMRAIDPRQLTAAQSLGARPAEAFMRVYVPQTLTGVVSGVVLVFVVSLGFFVTPALIGGTRETTVAQIIYMYINELYDWGRSSSLAIVLMLTVAAVLTLASRSIDHWSAFGIRTAFRARRPRRGRGGAWLASMMARFVRRAPLQRHGGAVCLGALLLVLAVLNLPLLFVLAVSFQPLRMVALPTEGLSLLWYERVLTRSEWLDAAANSLQLAALSTVIALAIGYFLAVQVRMASPALRALLTALAIGPLALPHIVLAVGIYGVYLQLDLVGSRAAVAVAHAAVAVPYVFVNILNGLSGYDARLDAAAASLGARPWTALRRVRLPLLAPALVAAAALAFLVSMDELVVTLFTAGVYIQTLPLRMWAAATQNLSPELAVVGTLLVVLVLAGAALYALAVRRSARRGGAVPAPAET